MKYLFAETDEHWRAEALSAIANELAEVNTHLHNLEMLGSSLPRIRSFSVPDLAGDANNSPYASDLINTWHKPKDLEPNDVIIIRVQVDPAPVTTYIGSWSSIQKTVEVSFPEDERIPCFLSVDKAKEWFYKYNKPTQGEIVTIV